MNCSNIIIIGAGGTGSALISPLTKFLNSVGYTGDITICDGDHYEYSNLDRQMFDPTKVGINKAQYQAENILYLYPDMEDKISIIDEYLDQETINEIITEDTIIINCVDNKAARKYVEDRVSQLNNAVHICCGNELRDGQVNIHVRRNGQSITPSIYEDTPEFDSSNDDRSAMTCQQIQELPSGGQLICANMMAATIALAYVTQLFSKSPIHKEGEYIPTRYVQYDIYTLNFQSREGNPIRI